MSDLRHFIIFQRTDGHCATWLMRAATLREALLKYALEEFMGAELQEDGSIAVEDGYGGKSLYEHPLAAIESEAKTFNGGCGWNGWEIRELQEQHWQAGFAEVFCSENPFDVQDYIELCRPLLRQRHPRSRARAFVWYLNDGPLVTFYRPTRPKRRWPIEILGRYQLPWATYPQVHEWSGTYEDILEQMFTLYPLPWSHNVLE
jgi:hypothetical protein